MEKTLRWRDKLREFAANVGKSPEERIKFKAERVSIKPLTDNDKVKILCSVHACSSMAEGRRLVAAGMFEKVLRGKGFRPLPGVPAAFDVSNVVDEKDLEEFIKFTDSLKEDK